MPVDRPCAGATQATIKSRVLLLTQSVTPKLTIMKSHFCFLHLE